MPRKFELTISWSSNEGSFTVDGFDKLMSDDLVQLLSQFVILIAQIQRRISEEDNQLGKYLQDKDIPF